MMVRERKRGEEAGVEDGLHEKFTMEGCFTSQYSTLSTRGFIVVAASMCGVGISDFAKEEEGY